MARCYFYTYFYILYEERDRMPDLNTQSIEDASATKYGYGYVRVSTETLEELSPVSLAKLRRENEFKNNINIL